LQAASRCISEYREASWTKTIKSLRRFGTDSELETICSFRMHSVRFLWQCY